MSISDDLLAALQEAFGVTIPEAQKKFTDAIQQGLQPTLDDFDKRIKALNDRVTLLEGDFTGFSTEIKTLQTSISGSHTSGSH